MITIKNVLNKIKWDKREKIENYSLEYLDRIENKNVELKFRDIKLNGDYVVFGEKSIPLHRIRKVKRNGKIIWYREGKSF